MITILLVTCFAAITAYCALVAWPRLRWSMLTAREGVRPQARVERPRYDLRDNSASRPAPPKR